MTLAFLLGAAFLAAFVDAVVGGGGLISMPALLTVGLPPAYALGTNKVASSMGAITSFLSFWTAGKLNKKLVCTLMPLSFCGAIAGAYTVKLLPPEVMKNFIVVLLVCMAIYTNRRKDWGDVSRVKEFTAKVLVCLCCMALAIGFYDGFFGPGTGTFLIFGFLFTGFDFVTAAGNAKALNFASNFGALLTFWGVGTVYWQYGIPMGIAMICGAFLGSRVAIAKGAAYVRPLYLTVTTLLIGKLVYEAIFK